MMAEGRAKAITMWNCFNSSAAFTLLALLCLPITGQAQIPLPDQTTVEDSQQITIYDATLAARERNRRITVGLLRSGLIPIPSGIVDGQFISFVGGQFVAVPAPSGGMADGVATAGVFNSVTNQIVFSVSSPGADFSVDVSGIGSGSSFEVQHHGVTIRTDPTFINIVGPGGVTGSGLGVDIDPGIRGFTMDRIGFVTSVDFSTDFAIGRSGDDGRVAIENSLARDNELPSAVDLSESGGDLTLTVTMPGRTNLTDTVPAASKPPPGGVHRGWGDRGRDWAQGD